MLPILAFALPVAGVAAITKFHLSGEDLSRYDGKEVSTLFFSETPGKGSRAVDQFLKNDFMKTPQGQDKASALAAMRARFDLAAKARKLDSEFRPATIPTDHGELGGAWTLVKGADPTRRILYLHGGAFTMGSAISHRSICHNLAKRTGCVVFAPNYRLMPEHSRRDGIEDVKAAYRWIADNGPDAPSAGPSPASTLIVAGDSAGANLTLMLGNWMSEANIRKADALIALSALTDSTFSAPSIRSNFETDHMLRSLAEPIIKTPRSLLLWAMWKQLKIKPSAPEVSPIFASLDRLPPTLLQVSEHEMMRDDSLRYAAKAQEAGSDVTVQVWSHMPHVWHMFDIQLEQAREALDQIALWLESKGL